MVGGGGEDVGISMVTEDAGGVTRGNSSCRKPGRNWSTLDHVSSDSLWEVSCVDGEEGEVEEGREGRGREGRGREGRGREGRGREGRGREGRGVEGEEEDRKGRRRGREG